MAYLFSAFFIAYGEEQTKNTYKFSLGASAGFIYGQSFELVYPYDTPAPLCSQLIWDMKPVFYFGLQFDFKQINISERTGFFASVTFNIGIPSETGIMEDRDWLDKSSDHLTNFSSHTNITREFFWLDAAFGISIPVKNYFYIKPFAAGSWMRFAFTGKDGYGEYARKKSYYSNTYFPVDDNPVKYTFIGEVIRYQQDWLIAAAGLSIGTEIAFPLSFELSFRISPLVFCAASDEHLITGFTYDDYMSFGLYMEPKAGISFAVYNIYFLLEFSYRYIEGTKGFTNVNDGGIRYTAANSSGAGLSVFNTRFIISFVF